jgi:hypothetical protein
LLNPALWDFKRKKIPKILSRKLWNKIDLKIESRSNIISFIQEFMVYYLFGGNKFTTNAVRPVYPTSAEQGASVTVASGPAMDCMTLLRHDSTLFTCSQHISLRLFLVLFSHLLLGLPAGLFPLGIPSKTLYSFIFAPYVLKCQSQALNQPA